MKYIIKNTIRITILNSHQSDFYGSVIKENTYNEENTYNKNTFIRSNVK